MLALKNDQLAMHTCWMLAIAPTDEGKVRDLLLLCLLGGAGM